MQTEEIRRVVSEFVKLTCGEEWQMQKRYILILGLASSVAVMSCGKKKSTSAQEVSDAINNALAIGYPDGLSIPTFPKTTTTSSLALSEDDALGIDANDTKGQTLAQKRDDAKKILEGGVEDCFANLKSRGAQQLLFDDLNYAGHRHGRETWNRRCVFLQREGPALCARL